MATVEFDARESRPSLLGEPLCRAVAFGIVGHRPALAGLDRQAESRAVEGLNLVSSGFSCDRD